ncbi:hypothetical protein Glove_139g78 [Diversispora epigaea]|uniref:Uncharacterized protein n=1 Tax=Diversispora epigaea TaxID=1348612 RepID=A0A397J5U5_9GLOM|nr:hypothetical protein Glove_139g69 [Diversispora epigaea]RHZ80200.1 hypothetical protein Glove_139g73 [Diversispora epigaea]RHZ80212.1 hypothetical protein Glove_139g78 [Diversispora epigaea]
MWNSCTLNINGWDIKDQQDQQWKISSESKKLEVIININEDFLNDSPSRDFPLTMANENREFFVYTDQPDEEKK